MAPQKPITIPAQNMSLSAQTPGKHKANAQLATAFSSILPAALIAAMLPALCAGSLAGAALPCTFAVAIAVAVALGIAHTYIKEKRYTSIAAAVASAIAILLILAIPSIREGFFALYNNIVYHFDETYHAYLSLASSGALATDSLAFAVLIGILCGTCAWAITRMRTSSVTLLAVIVLCGGCLRTGCGLGFAATVLGLCGWLSQCRLTQLEGSSYPLATASAGAAFSVVVCALFFLACSALYTPNATLDGLYKTFTTATDTMRYGSDTLPEGDMAKAPSMNQGEDERLSVTVGGQVSDNLLLHGFTGATFENGVWQPLSHTSYEGEWKGIMPWLGKQGFVPAEQRASYNYESAYQGNIQLPNATTVTVDSGKANSQYVYAPYTLRELNGNASTSLDGAPLSGFIGTRNYSFTMDDVAATDTFTDTNWLEANESEYASSEAVYSAFVHANYLQVSDEEKEAVNHLVFNEATWDASAASSSYAVISRVRTMLGTLASYDEQPSSPRTDEPFTQWFLGEARQGNSAYFATVATFALRSQGIPARYVEGYRADSADVAAANGSSLTLTNHDAHAWVEVYLNGAGWTPVEVTPGFYSQAVEADKVIDVSEARSNGSGDVSQAESVMGQMDEDQAETQQPSALQVVLQAATGVFCFIGCLVLLAIATVVQRKLRIARRTRAIESEEQATSVPALFAYLASVMTEANIGFDKTRPLECANNLQKAFPEVSPEEYYRVVTLHQAFAFGEHTLKPNEMRTLRRFTARMHASLPEPTTMPKRFKRWAVKAL